MFRKYFAHEFKNTCQMPLTICGLILGLSILFCIGAVLKLEFLLTLGIVAIGVCSYACTIMAYVSIHKTLTCLLFTKSGYLTLTLPVSTHTILISKILVNFIYAACYTISFIFGVFIVLGGFGLLDSISSVLDELYILLKELFNSFDLILIYAIQGLLSFVFFLCFILFCNAVSNSGYIKKQNKMLKFIITVIFVTAVTYLLTVRIIPYALVYGESGYRVVSAQGLNALYEGLVVIDFSVFFWILVGTLGLYFGSYYLIKNKIDIL